MDGRQRGDRHDRVGAEGQDARRVAGARRRGAAGRGSPQGCRRQPSGGPWTAGSEATGMTDSAVRERTISTNGVKLHVLEAGPANGLPVVLCHGFPELAYSWRHQLPALGNAGYHVIAPDQRGYGQSSKPEAIEDYDILHLTGDLIGLLDALDIDKAVFVGHDWGSMVVWQMALLHPDRVAGVVGMSVPYMPRSPMPPVQLMRQMFADNFFYIVYFQEPGVADADLGADAGKTMRRLLVGASGSDPDAAATMAANDGRGFVDRIPEPDGLPDWLT